MKELVYQRIKRLLEDKQVAVNALAKSIDMAQTTLNTQLRGERALLSSVVEKILHLYPEVSAEWLLRGDGEMFKKGAEPIKEVAQPTGTDVEWKIRYEELEKRYTELINLINGKL